MMDKLERMEIIAAAVSPNILHKNLMRAVDGPLSHIGDWIIEGGTSILFGNVDVETKVGELRLSEDSDFYTHTPKPGPISAEFEELKPTDFDEYMFAVTGEGKVFKVFGFSRCNRYFRQGRAKKTKQEAIDFRDTEQQRIRYQQVCARLRAAYPGDMDYSLRFDLTHGNPAKMCRAHSGGFPESQYDFIRENFSDDVLMRVHGWAS